MPRAPHPCLDCGTITYGSGPRCIPCSKARTRERNAQPARQAYRAVAYRSQPKVGLCHLCGQPGADTRDHLIPIAVQVAEFGSVIDHRALPAHRACNSSRQATPLA